MRAHSKYLQVIIALAAFVGFASIPSGQVEAFDVKTDSFGLEEPKQDLSKSGPAWKTTNIGGIHYAIERSSLHPDRWKSELQHTYDCEGSCAVKFDDRMSAMHLRYKWAQLNPKPGQYDFKDLGAVLDRLHASKKMATLIIMGGKYTPSWVIDKGAKYLPLTAKTNDEFSQKFVPVPWDPIYLREYKAMHEALATYLRKKSRYRTVVMVKNGALTIHSGETRMMPREAFSHHGVEGLWNKLCKSWASAGYTEEKALSAFRKSNKAIAEAFPDQYIGLAYVGGFTRFPTVNDKGHCVKNGKNETMSKLIRQMVKSYGARSVINNTVLTPTNGNPPIMQWVKKNGGNIAFQVDRPIVGCHKNLNGNCDTELFTKTLQTAIDVGALFAEVHDGNIERYKHVLPFADMLLARNWKPAK